MNFDLSDEQKILQESLQRLLRDHYGFETRRAIGRQPLGWRQENWRRFAELGLLAAPFAEVDGGLGGGAIETLVVADAFGAHLVAEPYLSTIVLCGSLIGRCANAKVRSRILPELIAGKRTAAFAHDEAGPRSPMAPRKTSARREGETWLLSGSKLNVLHGASSDVLTVTADTPEGAGIFLIDATAPGVVRRGYATFDGQRAAEINFVDAAVPAGDALALGEEAEMLVERSLQDAIAFLAAEARGVMRMLVDITVEHLKTRKQFGQALASFQALQHRAVEMLVATEQTESISLYAAMMTQEPDVIERRKAFAAAKAVVGASAPIVGQGAVQLHGGIGVTDECRAGWGMKRLAMIEMMLGDTEHHLSTLAEFGGFVSSAE